MWRGSFKFRIWVRLILDILRYCQLGPQKQFHWNMNKTTFFFQENVLQNVACKLSAIFSRPQYIKILSSGPLLYKQGRWYQDKHHTGTCNLTLHIYVILIANAIAIYFGYQLIDIYIYIIYIYTDLYWNLSIPRGRRYAMAQIISNDTYLIIPEYSDIST